MHNRPFCYGDGGPGRVMMGWVRKFEFIFLIGFRFILFVRVISSLWSTSIYEWLVPLGKVALWTQDLIDVYAKLGRC